MCYSTTIRIFSSKQMCYIMYVHITDVTVPTQFAYEKKQVFSYILHIENNTIFTKCIYYLEKLMVVDLYSVYHTTFPI